MKYCNKCGTQNEDSSNFCLKCGNTMNVVQAVPQPQWQTQPYANYPAPRFYVPEAPPTDHPVIKQIKAIGSSPLFLATAITYSVMVLFVLVNLFVTSLGKNDIGEPVSIGIQITSLITGIIAMTPEFLILAGLWMVFSSSRQPENRSTGGLTLIKASVITLLVCVFCAVALLLSVISIALSATINNSGILKIEIIICAITFLCVVIAFGIIYFSTALKVLGAIKQTLYTAIPSFKGMGLFVVLNFIGASFSVIWLLLNGVFHNFAENRLNSFTQNVSSPVHMTLLYNTVKAMFQLDIFEIIYRLLSAGVLVLFGILLFTYKKKMQVLTSEDSANILQTPEIGEIN